MIKSKVAAQWLYEYYYIECRIFIISMAERYIPFIAFSTYFYIVYLS